MDIARIGIEVSAKGASAAARDLGRMNTSMGDTERRAGNLNKGMSATDRAMSAMSRSSERSAKSIMGMGASADIARKAVGLLGVAMAGLGLGSALSQIKEFERGMSRVQAISRSSTTEMRALEKAAREMGATTSFSAAQATDGMASLAMAGLNTNQIIKALPSTLSLARAGALDLGQAASITSNTMKAFKLEAEDTARIADVLALASNSANTDIQGLGEGFKYAAPWSKALGVSVETTAAALGVLADNALQAGQGGTGLAAIYRQLTKVTAEGEQVLDKYSLTLADVDIKAKGFTSVIETLASKSLSAEDALRLFGAEAGLAANILLSSKDRLGELNSEMYNAADAARAAADAMGNNLSGDLDQLGSAISEVVLQVNDGSGLGSHLRTLTQIATETIAVMFDFSKANKDSSEEMKRINAIAKDMAAALGLVKDAAIAVAVIMAGRYLSSIVAATAAKVRLTAASLAGTVQMNAMGVVISRTTWQTNVMTAATNALGGAMRLLGGPVGLITVAASALYIFANRTTQAEKDAKALQGRIDGLAGSFENLGRRQAEAALIDYIDYGKQLSKELAIASARVEQMNVNMMRSRGSKKLDEWNKNLIKFSGAQETAEKAVAANEAAMKQLKDIINGTNKVTKTNTIETDTNTGSTGSNTDTKVKAAKATKQLSDEAKHYNDLMRDGEALNQKQKTSTEKTMEAQQRLNELRAIGAITERTYKQEMAELNSEMDYAIFQTEALAEQSTVFTRAWENAIDRIDRTFIDLFRSAFDGFKDFTKSIKDTFKNLLAELAYAAVKNKIMISVGMGVAGTSGIANAAGAALGGGSSSGGIGDLFQLGNLAKSANSLMNGAQSAWAAISGGYATGGVGGAVSGAGSYIGSLFGGSSAAASSGVLGGTLGGGGVAAGLHQVPAGGFQFAGGGAGGMLGAALPFLGAGLGGYMLGGMLPGKANIGGGIGAALGMIGGPLGALAGGAIGSVVGSLFGNKYKEYINETRLTAGGAADAGIDGHNYREEKKRKAWGSTSYRRYYDPLDSELKGGLNQAYDQSVDGVQGLFSSIGIDVSEAALRGVKQAGLTIKKGTSAEDSEKMLEKWMADITDNMVKSVDSELTIERLSELGIAITSVNDVLKTLRMETLSASKVSAEYAEELIQLSGGMEAMANQTTYFYENFYSEEEKLANTSAALEDAFKSINRTVPSTREEFRAIVESLDLTTEGGRVAYATMMQLAPSFNLVADAAKKLADANKSLIDAAKDTVRQSYDRYITQSQRLQIELMKLMGDESGILAVQRQAELEAMDESLRPFQERVWALQDERQAMIEVGQAYAQANKQLSSALGSIQGWIDQRNATSGSPTGNLAASEAQFNKQLDLAKSGDFGALQSLTQYADRYLQSAEGMFASGPEAQRIEQEILKAMEGLQSVDPYEFLADEIKTALDKQTADLRERLHDVVIKSMPTDASLTKHLQNSLNKLGAAQLTESQVRSALAGKATDEEITNLIRSIDTNSDGIISAAEVEATKANGRLAAELAKTSAYIGSKQLTHAEVRSALSGKATDAEIDRLIKRADANSDGIITATELSAIRINANLTSELSKQIKILGGKQMTVAEVREALKGKATDAEIDKLIRRVDTNGDGIISATELSNLRIQQLLPGIQAGLSQLGSSIDTSMDGLIDYGEFSRAFSGMATDAELRKLFNMMDKNGDGQISLLDEVKKSSDEVGGNTSQLESEAKKQLSALQTNTAEMVRQTSQFVAINTTMASLRDAIAALANIQAEQAAKKAEEARLKEEARLSSIRARDQEVANLASQASAIKRQRDAAPKAIEDAQKRSAAHKSAADAMSQPVNSKTRSHLTQQAASILAANPRMSASEYESAIGGFHNLWKPFLRELFKSHQYDVVAQDQKKLLSSSEAELARIERRIKELQSIKFATGGAFTNGIVSRATSFPMGMMGEAGPEAIMPLANVGGSLGVKVAKEGNGEELAEMRKQNQSLQATIKVLQAGFSKLIEKADEGNESLDDINRNSRLNGGLA